MTHPYRSQPAKAFWKKTISGQDPLQIGDWYERRFSLDGACIATAGSCFAQHIGRNLRDKGFDYLDMEPAPKDLPANRHQDYGYGMYSARYGNVYTARQMLQLAQRATGGFVPREPAWKMDGGVVDPFRPTIEVEPLGSEAEMRALQQDHLGRVAEMLRRADVFVFTLGLTESWISREDGAVFPLCPGTAGGAFDPARHAFHNLTAAEVRADMEAFLALVRGINPALKLLLTVSPVPLMATATGQQVAVASAHSKAVLRAVAGELSEAHDFVDYFPSYEIITAPFMQGRFYGPDQRAVLPRGVAHVMSVFFGQHPPPGVQGEPGSDAGTTTQGEAAQSRPKPRRLPPGAISDPDGDEDVKCDEELLNAFGKDAQ